LFKKLNEEGFTPGQPDTTNRKIPASNLEIAHSASDGD